MRKRTGVIVHAGPVVSAAATGSGRALDVDGRPHVLTPLDNAVLGELSWVQPAVLRREWQLVSERGEHLLIRGRGLTGRHCTVETPAATWALARGWIGDVELSEPEGRTLARIQHRWFQGARLEPAAGPSLVWRWRWLGDRTLGDEEDHELLRLTWRPAFMRWQATVALSDAARRRDDLLELLATTFFAWLSERRSRGH
jgi:hypothetical protein